MRSILSYTLPYIKKHKHLFFMLCLTQITYTVFQLLYPYVEAQLINILSIGKSFRAFTDILIYLVAIHLILTFLNYISRIQMTRFNLDVSYDMISDIVEKLEHSFMSDLQAYDAGFLANRISTDCNAVLNFVAGNMLEFFLQGITGLFISYVLWIKSPIVTVLLFISIFLYILSYIYFKEKIYKVNLKLREVQDYYFQVYLRRLESILITKIHSLYKLVRNHLFNAFIPFKEKQIKAVKTSLSYETLRSLIQIFVQIIIFMYVGKQILNDQLTLGDMFLILNYATMLFGVTQYYVGFLEEYQVALVSQDLVYDLLKIKPEKHGNIQLSKLENIDFGPIDYTFLGSEKSAFDIHDKKSVKKGELVFLKGENGSGKTTFLYYLLGILSNENSKNVYYNGISLEQIDLLDFRENQTFTIMQSPSHYLEYPRVLIENYMEVENFLEQTSSGKFPFDVTSLIDKKFTQMSHGERQKWAIIESCLKSPSILLLDEPTSALDSESKILFKIWLKEFKKDRIVFMISHDEKLLSLADQVILFS